MPDGNGVDPQSAIARAIKQVLRPLVKLMLAKNITYPFVAELLKQVMVEVAHNEFRLQGKAQTDSRISLLTGVHRKDVKRLREAPNVDRDLEPSSVTLGAELVATWTTSAPFATRSGHPKKLARLASAGGESSFEALVASVSTDIRSRAVLDEWLRLGIVHLENDHVVLNTEAFVPEQGAEEKAFYFGHNLHDHAAAATHNVLGGQPPFFERSVHYNALSQSSIDTLAKLGADTGTQTLKALNRRAMELERKDAKTTEPKHRFTLGIYFFSQPSNQDDQGR